MTRRLFSAVAAAALLGVTATAIITTPVDAVTRPGITVTQANTAANPVKATYGPLVAGWFPANQALNWFPSGCRSGGQGMAVCDVVTIDIVPPPNINLNDTWWVDVEVTWAQLTPVNDIDIFLWDDQQIYRRNNSTGDPWHSFGESATSANPETIRAVNPTLGRYNLTVVNYIGVHPQYTVTASMTVGEKFVDPFELLEDPPVATAEAAPPAEVLPDLSGLDGFEAPADFTGLEDLGTFAEDLGTSDLAADGVSPLPPAPRAPSLGSIANVRPGPASGILMFLWLVLVPAALIGGASTYVATRARRHAFV